LGGTRETTGNKHLNETYNYFQINVYIYKQTWSNKGMEINNMNKKRKDELFDKLLNQWENEKQLKSKYKNFDDMELIKMQSHADEATVIEIDRLLTIREDEAMTRAEAGWT